jgi:hypothetical protein
MNIRKILVPDAYKLKADEDNNYSSIILDQELDPFNVDFDGFGCAVIEMGDMANIVLSIDDLKELIKLIRKADKLSQKNYKS